MSTDLTQGKASLNEMGNDYQYGFRDKEDYVFKSGRGLTKEIVTKISEMKNEPQWMLDFRLKALDVFLKKPMPTWGNCDLLNAIDFENIYYYIKPSEKQEKSWDEVPEGSRIPSIVWRSQLCRLVWWVFCLGACWRQSRDTLASIFRINAENMGQFERTLIIAEPGSFVHYIEGCTAPTYSTDSLHSAVVELIAKPGAHIRYTTIQNWSRNVYNLVTKRAVAQADAKVEWVDGNLGSKLTMKYPAIYLTGPRAHGEVLSIAFAGNDQHQDAGAKIIHAAPDTSSMIVSKSISKNGGRTSYRGLIKVAPNATGVKSSVKCDALLLDEDSRSDTYPTMEIDEKNVTIEHEASVSKVGEEQLFYLMSRGLSQDEATAMIVNGFFEPFTKELPLEYAVELNRLIQLEMEGSVG
ncbi:hypothetical protein Lal_00007170 [Lupinus albus]|nr:hypothetical protein Lal_00007170 [Lupinus albus]